MLFLFYCYYLINVVETARSRVGVALSKKDFWCSLDNTFQNIPCFRFFPHAMGGRKNHKSQADGHAGLQENNRQIDKQTGRQAETQPRLRDRPRTDRQMMGNQTNTMIQAHRQTD